MGRDLKERESLEDLVVDGSMINPKNKVINID